MVKTGVGGLQYSPRLRLWNGRKVSREREKDRKSGRQAKQTDHICARERRLTAGATLPPATNPLRPVLKSKQTETPLPHVNSTSTNNKLQCLSNPTPIPIPHAPDPIPSETSATNTLLVHGYSIITLFLPRTHSHAYSSTCTRIQRPCCSSLLPRGPSGGEHRGETVCVKMTFMLLWCLLHNPTWHLYNLLQGYTLHPLQKSCN